VAEKGGGPLAEGLAGVLGERRGVGERKKFRTEYDT